MTEKCLLCGGIPKYILNGDTTGLTAYTCEICYEEVVRIISELTNKNILIEENGKRQTRL